MEIYVGALLTAFTNCCENLIRILLTFECRFHKILINIHREMLSKKLFPIFNVCRTEKYSSATSPKNGLSALVIKTLSALKLINFNCRQWWWFIAGKFHLKLIVTWSSDGRENERNRERENSTYSRAYRKKSTQILI